MKGSTDLVVQLHRLLQLVKQQEDDESVRRHVELVLPRLEPRLDVGRPLVRLPGQSTPRMAGQVEGLEAVARLLQKRRHDRPGGDRLTGPEGRRQHVDRQLEQRNLHIETEVRVQEICSRG